MVLAELGADVLRISRSGGLFGGTRQTYHRSRPELRLDLKDPADRDTALWLIAQADASVEGFRPGVMERLGLGPDECLEKNPRLVYGRLTGWGQDGPWSQRAGHDINFLAMSGALDSFRGTDRVPVPPMNLLGDFGGGSMFLIAGLLSGIIAADRTGQGAVVDASIVDGVADMMASVCGRINDGSWSTTPRTNLLDSGAPFYRVYETSDGRFMAVGAIEPEFFAGLIDALGFAPDELPDQRDRSQWSEVTEKFAARFRSRTQDEWIDVFSSRDVCVTPVLSLDEAASADHLRAREVYRDVGFGVEPARAPRFSPGTCTVESETGSSTDSDAGPRRTADPRRAAQTWGLGPAWESRLHSESERVDP
jgi:alpha-methylacyl-CoA racemase